jgi:hypothetical protein
MFNGRGRAAWVEDLCNIATSKEKTINDLAWSGKYESGTASGEWRMLGERKTSLDDLKRTMQSNRGHDLLKLLLAELKAQ